MIAALIGVAGGFGAVTRFLVDTAVRRVWPTRFPIATVLINVTGSLLLGAVTAAVLVRDAPDAVRLTIGVGFCGGYTTFSTAMIETVRLGRERRAVLACANLLVQPIVCIAAAALGYAAVAA